MGKKKQDYIVPPSATGGEGYYFENHVQASFVALMFSKGFAPLFPEYQIDKVMLQANACGYETDDAVVFLKKGLQERKLLCQVKLTIKITPGDPAFKSSISDGLCEALDVQLKMVSGCKLGDFFKNRLDEELKHFISITKLAYMYLG